MNKREEDRMIEMVFGELDPNEESVLSHRVTTDEELAAFASEWEDLRDDLKSLKDIPEMQLSTERLRDAILGQGLRPEPAISWWNFAWVPVAACLALLIVVPSIRGNKSVPMIVMNDSATKPSSVFGDAPKLDLPKPKELVITVPPVTTVAKVDSTKAVSRPTARLAFAQPGGSSRKSLRANEATLQALMARSNPGRGTALTAGRDPMAKAQYDSAMTTGAETSAPLVEGDTVVLIEPGTDASTGANKATELASISNVVVGG